MKHKKLIITWMACASVCMNLSAQDADFDLSSQRSEAQDVLAVPGKKLDHQGIIINPTPHQLNWDKSNLLDISGGISLKDKQKKFAEDFPFVVFNKIALTHLDFCQSINLKFKYYTLIVRNMILLT